MKLFIALFFFTYFYWPFVYAQESNTWFVGANANLSKAVAPDVAPRNFAYDYNIAPGLDIDVGFERSLSKRLFLRPSLKLGLHGLRFKSYDHENSRPPDFDLFRQSRYYIWSAGLDVSGKFNIDEIFSVTGGYQLRFALINRSKHKRVYTGGHQLQFTDEYSGKYDIPSKFLHGPSAGIEARLGEQSSIRFSAWADLTSLTRFPSNWRYFSFPEDENVWKVDVLVYSLGFYRYF